LGAFEENGEKMDGFFTSLHGDESVNKFSSPKTKVNTAVKSDASLPKPPLLRCPKVAQSPTLLSLSSPNSTTAKSVGVLGSSDGTNLPP
jgi:hypothetical protein